jgi:hypothetical protein
MSTVESKTIDVRVMPPQADKLWTHDGKGSWVVEASDLPATSRTNCPACKTEILHDHLKSIDSLRGDILGWRYLHPCGARLFVVND